MTKRKPPQAPPLQRQPLRACRQGHTSADARSQLWAWETCGPRRAGRWQGPCPPKSASARVIRGSRSQQSNWLLARVSLQIRSAACAARDARHCSGGQLHL